MNPFDAASPLDARYFFAEPEFFKKLRPFVSESSQIKYLSRVEAALVAVLADAGLCSQKIAQEVADACDEIEPEEVYEEEARIQHNIRALVNCIRRRISEEAQPFVHLFATSNDMTDTARALCLKEVTHAAVLPFLADLTTKLIRLARANASVGQIGRTHGRHAVPITFGFAIALYVSRLGQRIEAIKSAADNLRGKFSGAVGAYNALTLYRPQDPQELEAALMRKLGLKPPEISSQIVQPEYVADYVYALASCWGVLANLADDFRHLLRSEIRELRARSEGDPNSPIVGSSTMPHKINPKDFENVKSLWKAYMPRLTTVLMDQISEHQRDLTNSASSRFVTEFVTGFCYTVYRASSAVDGVEPDRERMRAILNEGKDPIVAEPLYILLALAGHPDAHEKARVLARQARVENKPLVEIVRQDRSLDPYREKMTPTNRKILEDPALYTGAAETRTFAICDLWEKKLADLLRQP
ncbi:MAG: adenylosuccinate lyase [Gemmatales bacterium]|nr:MAG: adenylosuccinate lyase [Gemmatales bacterium]